MSGPPPPPLDAFHRLAVALSPDDPRLPVRVAEAGMDWRPPGDRDLDHVHTTVWGRLPGTATGGIRDGVQTALRRERGVRALLRRPRVTAGVGMAHRIAPPRTGRGPRRRVRSFVVEGAVVEVHATGAPRAIDAALAAAGFEPASTGHLRASADRRRSDKHSGVSRQVEPAEMNLWRGGSGLSAGSLRVGSGGSVLVADPAGGRILRAGAADTPSDPRAGARIVEQLVAAGVPCLPETRTVGVGKALGWAVETFLPGRRAWRLTPSLANAVVSWCGSLPRTEQTSSSSDDVSMLAPLVPEHAPRLHEIGAAVDEAFSDIPGVVRHGDLWLGNLLVAGGALVGVVDWDASSRCGRVGVDLLHLWTTCERMRTRRDLGLVFADRPWATDAFAELSRGYWTAVGVTPTGALLDALGLAWWLEQVAGDVRRNPRLASDDRWVAANLSGVVQRLST